MATHGALLKQLFVMTGSVCTRTWQTTSVTYLEMCPNLPRTITWYAHWSRWRTKNKLQSHAMEGLLYSGKEQKGMKVLKCCAPLRSYLDQELHNDLSTGTRVTTLQLLLLDKESVTDQKVSVGPPRTRWNEEYVERNTTLWKAKQ